MKVVGKGQNLQQEGINNSPLEQYYKNCQNLTNTESSLESALKGLDSKWLELLKACL